MRTKEWLVGFVNFNTAIYMEKQLQTLYEANTFDLFNVIIVDNSPSFDFDLAKIVQKYYKKYKNIKIIYNRETHKQMAGSGQHAQGLEVIVKNAKNPRFLLLQDPDFFWVIPNYLSIFSQLLQKGNTAVGAPYPRIIGLGHPDFPALYGCAMHFKDVLGVSLLPNLEKAIWNTGVIDHPLAGVFSHDVGYVLREKLSVPWRKNFISFDQYDATQLKDFVGVHSYEFGAKAYYFNGKLFAFHLFRGSFTSSPLMDESGIHIEKNTPQAWTFIREKYSNFFYELFKNPDQYKKYALIFSERNDKRKKPLFYTVCATLYKIPFTRRLSFLFDYQFMKTRLTPIAKKNCPSSLITFLKKVLRKLT